MVFKWQVADECRVAKGEGGRSLWGDSTYSTLGRTAQAAATWVTPAAYLFQTARSCPVTCKGRLPCDVWE